MTSPTTAALAIALLLLPAAPAQSQTRRAMTIDDVLDLVQLSAPRISPDGSRVLFTRAAIEEWKDNKRVATIWIANADGTNEYQFLASDKDKDPAWSPDGSRVAFLSTRDQDAKAKEDVPPQIWIIPSDGGEASKLTDHRGAIKGFEWAADGTRIFFLAEQAQTDEEKAAEKAGQDALFVDEGPNGQERGRYTEIWEIAVAGGRARQVSRGRLLIGDFKPSPDGRRIAVIHRPDAARNTEYRAEVAVIDVESGDLTDLTKNEAPEKDVAWSPDGAFLSYAAPSERSWELATDRLWTVPAGGGAPRLVSREFDGDIAAYFWAPDGKSIWVGGSKRSRGGAFQIDVASGKVRTVAHGDWNGTMESMSADRLRGALVLGSPASPPDVMLLDAASGRLTAVTRSNPHTAAFEMSQFRSLTWKSADGVEIEGHLWLPAAYKTGRLPLVLSIHGGPAGVWSTGFRGINHVYTGLGWAVLEPNVRGSSTYGDALLRGNMKDIGGGDFRDLMAGVDRLVADGIADPGRLAVRGWSYGGILGGWTITQTDRFKAASLGAMVADWPSEYAMGFNFDVRLWYIGGTPWDNPDGFRQKSPYTHIARVRTPTIIIHGDNDTTDTVGQSMIFYQGLKDRGVPTRFIRFPREPHNFREPAHQRIRDAEEISWLMKHTLGVEWTAPARKDPKADRKTTTP